MNFSNLQIQTSVGCRDLLDVKQRCQNKILINEMQESQLKLKSMFHGGKGPTNNFFVIKNDTTYFKDTGTRKSPYPKFEISKSEAVIIQHQAEMKDDNKHAQLKEELNEVKENDICLAESVSELMKKNQEKDRQISELEHELDRIEQHLQEMRSEKESNDTSQIQMVKIRNENERLELELKYEHTALQEQYVQNENAEQLRQETEAKLHDIINKQAKYIHDLHEDIKRKDINLKGKDFVEERNKDLEHHLVELHKEEITFTETVSELISENKDKDDEISELNQQLYSKLDTIKQTDLALQNAQKALQIQKKNADIDLQRHDAQFKDAMKLWEKTKAELNDIIKTKNRKIKLMQEEIEKKDYKINEHERNTQVQQELLQSHKKEAAIRKSFNELRKRNQENEEKISELRQQVKVLSETLRQKDTEIKYTILSMQRKLENKETEKEQLKREKEQLKRIQDEMKEGKEESQLKLHQLNEILATKLQRVAKLDNLNRSLQIKFNIMETKLKQYELEVIHKKELASSIAEMNRKIKCLDLEMKEKETKLQDYSVKCQDAVQTKAESESNLNEEFNKQKRQIQHFQEEINKSEHIKLSKDSALSEAVKELQSMNQEKENKIFMLEHQLKITQETLNQRETEWQNAIASVQVKLQTAEREVETSKLETEKSYNAQEQMKEEIERLKLEVCQLNEISSATKKEVAEPDYLNRSLQMQSQIMEQKLKQCKQDLSHKKELVSSKAEMDRHIECLKLEVKGKETTRRDYIVKHDDAVKEKENSESKLIEVINKQRREIQYLQGELHKRDTNISKDTAMIDENVNELRNKNQEKEDEIIELKHQLKIILGTLNQREVEYQNVIESLKGKLQNVERMAELSKQERIQEKEQSCRSEKQMKAEIEQLKIEGDRLNLISGAAAKREAEFENIYRLLQDSENERDLAVSKSNEIINNQNKEIQHLQEEIDKRNHKITTLEEERLRYSKVERALKTTKENKSELHETFKVLQIKNQELEHRISQLTHQMNESIDSFNQKEYDLKEMKCSLQRTIETLETDLDHRKQEITNEKQLSKSLQIKMTKLRKDMESLMNEKEMKERENKDTKDYLSGIIDSQTEKIQHLEKEVQQQDNKVSKGEEEAIKKVKAVENKLTDLKDQLKHTSGKLHDTETELNETKSRLSRVMGDRLTDNNPNITDLSDKNRPTKIAEKFAELYDNQWTDAFDVLENHFQTEEVVIEALLHILQDIMLFCQTMAQRQMKLIKRQITFATTQDGFEVPCDIQKLLKDLRKAMASAVVENLEKIYVSQLEQSGDKTLRAALDVDEYTSECIEICWFMVVQDPPVVFGPLPKEGSSFDTDFYKPYTKSGTHVEYSVWPSLLLHEGGPILAKGVAQGLGQRVKYV